MGKIVNINENDLKRIVKRVLNERQQLNEELLTIALWAGGAALVGGVGQEVYNWWASGDVKQRTNAIFEMCSRGGVEGKPAMDKKDHENLAKRFHTACPGTGMFTNCDEEDMVSILGEVESVPDLCGMIDEFRVQGHGDMFDVLSSAIDTETWWEKVNNALTPAFRKTQEANEDSKISDSGTTDGTTSGGGSTKDYTAVSGEGSVRELQQILKDKGLDIGSSGVDGSFGPATLKATLKALRAS